MGLAPGLSLYTAVSARRPDHHVSLVEGKRASQGVFFFECGPTGGIFRFFYRKPLLGHNSGKFVENHSQILQICGESFSDSLFLKNHSQPHVQVIPIS